MLCMRVINFILLLHLNILCKEYYRTAVRALATLLHRAGQPCLGCKTVQETWPGVRVGVRVGVCVRVCILYESRCRYKSRCVS